MLSGYLTCNAKALDSNTNIVQSPAASDKIDESVLSDEKTVQSKINRSTKEVNNVLKQIKLDASFSDVQYNKKDKIIKKTVSLREALNIIFRLM